MQGHMQTLAISKIFDIEKVYIYDILESAMIKYQTDRQKTVQGDIIFCSDPREVALGAAGEVIISVTQSNEQFLKEQWVANKKSSPDLFQKKTICIPIGTGAMDIAIASVVLKKAQEAKMGEKFDFV